MDIELRFFANFREAVGQKIVTRTYDDDTTVGEVLAALEAEYEGLDQHLLDEQGETLPQLSIMRNGRDVAHLEGVRTGLDDGDRLSVFPPVAGGSRD